MTRTPAEDKEKIQAMRAGVIRLDPIHKAAFLAAFKQYYQSFTRDQRLFMPRITHGYFIMQAVAALVEKRERQKAQKDGDK